jgi:hypothetical protein
MPIEFYTRCLASKTKDENIPKATHRISFAYERNDHLQFKVAYKDSLDYDQVFGLKNIEDRGNAA